MASPDKTPLAAIAQHRAQILRRRAASFRAKEAWVRRLILPFDPEADPVSLADLYRQELKVG